MTRVPVCVCVCYRTAYSSDRAWRARWCYLRRSGWAIPMTRSRPSSGWAWTLATWGTVSKRSSWPCTATAAAGSSVPSPKRTATSPIRRPCSKWSAWPTSRTGARWPRCAACSSCSRPRRTWCLDGGSAPNRRCCSSSASSVVSSKRVSTFLVN